MKTRRGLTFIEVILVLAITLSVGVVATSLSGGVFFDKQVAGSYEVLRSDIRMAQLSAMEGRGDSEWGVALRERSLILFQGSSYASRDAAFDVVHELPSIVSFTGFDEVVAEKRTGKLSGSLASLNMEGYGISKYFSLTQEGALQEE